MHRLQSRTVHEVGRRVKTLSHPLLCRGLLWVLKCLLDIVYGVEYMHHNSILHGDLKCANVLCKACSTDMRGFICKVGFHACIATLSKAGRPATGLAVSCLCMGRARGL